MTPTLGSADVSTARHVPRPAAITKRNAFSISMMVCRTRPPRKCSPVPLARLCTPAARADRCSLSSRVKPRDAATTRPSLDKTSACSMCSTCSTRLSSSQLSCPVASVCAITGLSLPVSSVTCARGAVEVVRSAELPALLHLRHHVADRLRCPVVGAGLLAYFRAPPRLAAVAQLRGHAGLGNPDWHPEMESLRERHCRRRQPTRIRVRRRASCDRRWPPGVRRQPPAVRWQRPTRRRQRPAAVG